MIILGGLEWKPDIWSDSSLPILGPGPTSSSGSRASGAAVVAADAVAPEQFASTTLITSYHELWILARNMIFDMRQ